MNWNATTPDGTWRWRTVAIWLLIAIGVILVTPFFLNRYHVQSAIANVTVAVLFAYIVVYKMRLRAEVSTGLTDPNETLPPLLKREFPDARVRRKSDLEIQLDFNSPTYRVWIRWSSGAAPDVLRVEAGTPVNGFLGDTALMTRQDEWRRLLKTLQNESEVASRPRAERRREIEQ